jgi:primosomal protein N' (replication factor Y)
MLRLTKWMADYYMASWGQVLQLALPKGIEKKSNIRVEPELSIPTIDSDLTENQRLLYDAIVREPGKTTSYYRRLVGVGSFSYNLRKLEMHQLVYLKRELSGQRVRKKMIKLIEVHDLNIEKFSGLKNQQELREQLRPYFKKQISLEEFKFAVNLSSSRIKTLSNRHILEISDKEIKRSPVHQYHEKLKQVKLNKEQKAALEQIDMQLEKNEFKVFLLHGVTGSGKTQVYLESIARAQKLKKSAIVLIPEISLTPQTVSRFESFFPGKINVFHSRMSLGERYDTWRKVNEEDLSIVIGPRSALFLPVKNLGIIIIDEEHDSSYKQFEPAPRYHARDMAIYRASINNAAVVLGSATPAMESYYNAHKGKYHLLELKNRVNNLDLPEIRIINTKNANFRPGGSNIISAQLSIEIENCLKNKEQIILLQNRRGFSTFVQCKTCGFSNKCPNCDIYLTYHTYNNSNQCHYCGFSQTADMTCPKCYGDQIKFGGAGTQQIEEALYRSFPDIRILRMDIDTTAGKGKHANILQKFKNGAADVLLGTQMISKGLDFENVSLVGVINADIGLTLPDFRSSERIFQLLTQVAGRPGRTKSRGRVIIQTALENHYAIKFARKHDYIGFFEHEFAYRRESGYPPCKRLIKIGISAADKQQAVHISTQIIKQLRRMNRKIYSIIGPAPSARMKIKNKYRWQIIIKINIDVDPNGRKTRNELRRILTPLIKGPAEKEQIYIDVDPLELL